MSKPIIFLLVIIIVGVLIILKLIHIIYVRKKRKFQYALNHIKEGSYERAIHLLKDVIQNDSENPAYHYHLGRAYFYVNDTEKAVTELTAALKLDEEQVISEETVYDYLIDCYKKIEDHDKVVKTYKELIEKFPQNRQYKLGLAEEYFNNKEVNSSLEILTQLENEIELERDELNLKAKCLVYKNKREEAITVLRQLLNKHPEFAEAYFKLGILYKSKRDYIAGIDVLVPGLSISTGELKYKMLMVLVQLFIETKEYEAALENLRQFYSEFKNEENKYKELNYFLGLSAKGTGDTGSAKKYWQKVYKIDPNYGNVKMLLGSKKDSLHESELRDFIKELNSEEFSLILTELAKKFSAYIKNVSKRNLDETDIYCNSEGHEIIISLRLWHNPVSDILITEFLEHMTARNLTKGILVLTTTLTKEAKQLVDKSKEKVKIMDRKELFSFLENLAEQGII